MTFLEMPPYDFHLDATSYLHLLENSVFEVGTLLL